MAKRIALNENPRSALATRAQRWPLLAWPTWTRSDWMVKAILTEYAECMKIYGIRSLWSQPINQWPKKSKSHYRVFLFQHKVVGKGKHTTSPEFKSDYSCFKSNLTSWWIQIAKPGKMFFLPWKEIEEKVIKRTLEDSWYSVGNICLDTKWQYQRTVGCGGNCCFFITCFPKRYIRCRKIEIKHDQVLSSRYWTFDCCWYWYGCFQK